MLKMFYIYSVSLLIFAIVKQKGQVRQLKVTLTPYKKKGKKRKEESFQL